MQELLEPLGSCIAGGHDHFVAQDHYLKDNTEGVMIEYIGENFSKHMLGLTEGFVPSAVLWKYRVKKKALDRQMIAELGHAPVHLATQLANAWDLLKTQGKGQKGDLSLDYPNVLYAETVGGEIWSLRMLFGPKGWGINSFSIDHSDKWPEGTQFFVPVTS